MPPFKDMKLRKPATVTRRGFVGSVCAVAGAATWEAGKTVAGEFAWDAWTEQDHDPIAASGLNVDKLWRDGAPRQRAAREIWGERGGVYDADFENALRRADPEERHSVAYLDDANRIRFKYMGGGVTLWPGHRFEDSRVTDLPDRKYGRFVARRLGNCLLARRPIWDAIRAPVMCSRGDVVTDYDSLLLPVRLAQGPGVLSVGALRAEYPPPAPRLRSHGSDGPTGT